MPELHSFNFDVIAAIDMKKFHAELARLMRSGRYTYIFCDGILLYEDEKLNKMLDKRYFLDLSKEECEKRRKERHYIIEDTGNYFEKCVWKEYVRYKQKCETMYQRKNIMFLRGDEEPEKIYEIVMTDILNNS